MNIILFDPITGGNQHAAFNATMAESLIKIPSVTKLTLLLEQNQLNQPFFEKLLNNPIIKVNALTRMSNNKEYSTMKARAFRAFSTYRQLYRVVRENIPAIVILLASDNVFSPLSLRFIAGHLKYEKSRLLLLFHNNIENIRMQNSIWKTKFIQLLWKNIINKSYNEVLVLSKFLVNIVLRYHPGARVKYLPHPTYANIHSRYIDPKQAHNKDIDFLFLGRSALEASNSGFLDEFISIVSRIWNYSPGDSRRIKIALPSSLYIRNEQAIEVEFYDDYPPFNRYLELMSQSRFLVIPPSGGLRLTASGILADTLTLGVPVIAPNSGPFADNSASQKGRFIYTTERELGNILKEIKKITGSEYLSIQKSILEYSENFSVKKTSERLRNILEESNKLYKN